MIAELYVVVHACDSTCQKAETAIYLSLKLAVYTPRIARAI